MPAAVRPEIRRRRQRRASAGGHPPGDFRQLRAVHRHPDRALRRGVPALAGAGAGGGAADRRPAPRVRRARCATSCGGRACACELDERQEKIGYKIREAQLQKIPYMLVVGRPGERPKRRCRCGRARGGDQGRTHGRGVHRRGARREWRAVDGSMAGAASARRKRQRIQVGGRYRFRQITAPRRPHARQRTHPRPRNPRHRRHGAAAGHHAAAAGAGHCEAEGARPGRDLSDGRAAGLPDHGLRQVPVPGAEAHARGAEAPEGHRGQGNQVPSEGGRARLPVQEEAHRALPRRRRQGQGDDLLPRPRDGAPGDRPADPRAAGRRNCPKWPSPSRCRGWKATRCTPFSAASRRAAAGSRRPRAGAAA